MIDELKLNLLLSPTIQLQNENNTSSTIINEQTVNDILCHYTHQHYVSW